jgi:N,N'-diacetylchitobiose transport system permease protein
VTSAPGPAAVAAEPTPRLARRRRRPGAWVLQTSVPYGLLLPATAVIAAVLAYPLYMLVKLSFQQYGLPELLQHKGVWIGTENYAEIFHDHQFWVVVGRTLVFTAACVAATMILGTLIALLLAQLGRFMRLLLTTGLVLVWATPVVVAVNLWYWMVDYQFGVLNWTLTKLHIGDFTHHDWFANPWSGFAVIGAVIVWGAIPFVAITVFAGLTQVPRELVEAAAIDGAGPLRIFRDMTLPIIKPILVILTSLSIIWDFRVFDQIWIMRDQRPTEDYFTMSIYSFTQAFNVSEYGLGAAISVVMVLTMFVVTVFYIRQMVRIGEVR